MKTQVTHSPPRGTLDKNAASSASGCAALAKELSSRFLWNILESVVRDYLNGITFQIKTSPACLWSHT